MKRRFQQTGRFTDTVGNQFWYQNGQLHREDGPAILYKNGDEKWYQYGLKHRTDGPALIYYNRMSEADNNTHITSEFWYQHDLKHRLDGPAFIFTDGEQQWWINNQLHRVDGPAIIKPNGIQIYYLNGIKLSYTDWKSKIQLFFNLNTILTN